MTDRKQPGVAYWATVVVVVGLLAYPLSLVIISLLDDLDLTPPFDSTAGEILWAYCAPLRWVISNGPDWIRDPLLWIFGRDD